MWPVILNSSEIADVSNSTTNNAAVSLNATHCQQIQSINLLWRMQQTLKMAARYRQSLKRERTKVLFAVL